MTSAISLFVWDEGIIALPRVSLASWSDGLGSPPRLTVFHSYGTVTLDEATGQSFLVALAEYHELIVSAGAMRR